MMHEFNVYKEIAYRNINFDDSVGKILLGVLLIYIRSRKNSLQKLKYFISVVKDGIQNDN